MKGSRSSYFIILFFIFSLFPRVSFAQEFPFTPRENVIFTALNRLQEREEAMRDSMQDAQMKLVKNRFIDTEVKAKGTTFFKNLGSRAHPYLNQETTFNDNIDAKPQSKKTGLTNTIKPGLKMGFGGRGKTLRADIHIDNSYVNNRPRSNSQDAEIDLLSNFNLGRYNLSLSEDYFNTHIAKPHFGIEKDFTHYWKNTFASVLGSQFNRLRFDIGYKRSDSDYEPDHSSGDASEETFSLNQYLLIATKTHLSLEYSHFRAKFKHSVDSSGDYKYDDYNLGLSNVLSAKLTDLISMDYKVTDCKTSTHYRDFTLMGKIAYRLSGRTDLALNLSRLTHEETGQAGNYINDNFSLSGNHRLAFNPKFSISFEYGANYYNYNKAMDANGERDIYSLGFGLVYAFRRWLDFGLDYTYNKTNYEFVPGSYHINTIIFTTQARF